MWGHTWTEFGAEHNLEQVTKGTPQTVSPESIKAGMNEELMDFLEGAHKSTHISR